MILYKEGKIIAQSGGIGRKGTLERIGALERSGSVEQMGALEQNCALEQKIVLDKPGEEHLTLVCVGGGRAVFDVDIVSPDVDLVLNGVYLCTGDDRLDIKVNVNHKVPGSNSSQLLRGVAGGRSRVLFDGKITVEQGAVKTKAFQTNNNIQLSGEAVVQTSPQLEIYADDVQCSHGATAGMLNEDELFYMRSRGLSLQEARRLQIVSFLTPAMVFLDPEACQRILDATTTLF